MSSVIASEKPIVIEVTVKNQDYQIRLYHTEHNEGVRSEVNVMKLEVLSLGGHFWKNVSCEGVDDAASDMEAIRYGIRAVRSRLCRQVRSYAELRSYAAAEKGGKRGYYTKQANYWLARVKETAVAWREVQAVWKQLTRLY